MFAAASLAALLLGTSPVQVSLAPGTPCLTADRLQERLVARGLQVGPAEAQSLVVTLRPEAAALRVEARRGEVRLQRDVPVGKGDCGGVERVVVALIHAWASPPVRAAQAPSPKPREAAIPGAAPAVASSRAPEPKETRASTAATSRTLPAKERSAASASAPSAPPLVATPTPDAGPASVDGAASAAVGGGSLPSTTPRGGEEAVRAETERATPSGSAPSVGTGVDPVPPVAPDPTSAAATPSADSVGRDTAGASGVASSALVSAPTGAPPTTAAVTVPPTSQRAWRLDVGAAAGVSLDAAGAPLLSGAGGLLVRGALGRYGLVLDGGLDATRSASSGSVTARVDLQWLSLSFSVAFEPHRDVTLDVALGVRGFRVAASATGLTTATDVTTLAAGGLLSAGVSYRVWGPVSVHARPSVGLRAQPLRFTVDPLGPVFTLPPVTVGALAGVLIRLP